MCFRAKDDETKLNAATRIVKLRSLGHITDRAENNMDNPRCFENNLENPDGGGAENRRHLLHDNRVSDG